MFYIIRKPPHKEAEISTQSREFLTLKGILNLSKTKILPLTVDVAIKTGFLLKLYSGSA